MKLKITIAGLVCAAILTFQMADREVRASLEQPGKQPESIFPTPEVRPGDYITQEIIHPETVHQILYTLEHHYKKMPLDDALSSTVETPVGSVYHPAAPPQVRPKRLVHGFERDRPERSFRGGMSGWTVYDAFGSASGGP